MRRFFLRRAEKICQFYKPATVHKIGFRGTILMFIRYDVAHGKAMPAKVVEAIDIEFLIYLVEVISIRIVRDIGKFVIVRFDRKALLYRAMIGRKQSAVVFPFELVDTVCRSITVFEVELSFVPRIIICFGSKG